MPNELAFYARRELSTSEGESLGVLRAEPYERLRVLASCPSDAVGGVRLSISHIEGEGAPGLLDQFTLIAGTTVNKVYEVPGVLLALRAYPLTGSPTSITAWVWGYRSEPGVPPTIGTAPAEMFVSPTALTLITSPGSDLDEQPILLVNRGGGILTWTAGSPSESWLTIAPASGSISAGANARPTITAHAAGLAAGTYSATIPITPSVGPVTTVTVTLNNLPPDLIVSPTALTITAMTGSNPSPQVITLTHSGSGTVTWSAAGLPSASWVSITPVSGSINAGGSSNLTVTVNATGLTPGTYSSTILITPIVGSGATTVTVTLTVTPLII